MRQFIRGNNNFRLNNILYLFTIILLIGFMTPAYAGLEFYSSKVAEYFCMLYLFSRETWVIITGVVLALLVLAGLLFDMLSWPMAFVNILIVLAFFFAPQVSNSVSEMMGRERIECYTEEQIMEMQRQYEEQQRQSRQGQNR